MEASAPARKSHAASAALRAAFESGAGDRVSAAEIIAALDGRAFGLGVLVFMTPVCLPMPPGVHTLAGVILAIFAIQMIVGRKTLWLPAWVTKRSIERSKLLAGYDKLEKYISFVERASRPRLLFLTGEAGTRAVGLVFLILASIMILPIPVLGNLPAAIASSLLALALAERDGAIILFGCFVAIIAVWTGWLLATAAVRWLQIAS